MNPCWGPGSIPGWVILDLGCAEARGSCFVAYKTRRAGMVEMVSPLGRISEILSSFSTFFYLQLHRGHVRKRRKEVCGDPSGVSPAHGREHRAGAE